MQEIFKDIKGYEGLYQVSDQGRIKSLNRKARKEKILKANIDGGGYSIVCLSKNGIKKTFLVHLLMAKTFLNHKPNGRKELVCDHRNNIRRDNRLENLQLITQRLNATKDQKGCSSDYIGVFWDNTFKKWVAHIWINGRNKHLGYFIDEKEAAKYYQDALKCVEENITEEIKVKKRKLSSKYKGVYYSKNDNKYKSQITINGKSKYIGSFTSEIEASKAYQNMFNEILKDDRARNKRKYNHFK